MVERYLSLVKQPVEIVDFGIQSFGTHGILELTAICDAGV